MKCKDCIHYDVCQFVDGERCWAFKNKTDVKEALDKQIPKPPIRGANLDYQCPVCGHCVGWVDALAWETEHHCICGQAINWNEILLLRN